MTRSGAPFHGTHGEGRTAISPAASQAGAEPCARAFPAARARRNAPVISDNAVVAAPLSWRAESTGSCLPLSRSATALAEIMALVGELLERRRHIEVEGFGGLHVDD